MIPRTTHCRHGRKIEEQCPECSGYGDDDQTHCPHGMRCAEFTWRGEGCMLCPYLAEAPPGWTTPIRLALTVAQLIEELQKMPSDAVVVNVDGDAAHSVRLDEAGEVWIE